MAKSQALIASELKVAALEARIAIATKVFKDQRATIRELEAKLATRGHIAAAPAAHIAPITTVSQYTDRFGRVFEKTRCGNKATTRELLIHSN